MDGPAETERGRESERGDYCLATEELQAARLPAAAAAADGSVALENGGGGGGVMVGGPSYFHGEERKGEKRHREWLTYVAAKLENFVCA